MGRVMDDEARLFMGNMTLKTMNVAAIMTSAVGTPIMDQLKKSILLPLARNHSAAIGLGGLPSSVITPPMLAPYATARKTARSKL